MAAAEAATEVAAAVVRSKSRTLYACIPYWACSVGEVGELGELFVLNTGFFLSHLAVLFGIESSVK